MANPLPLIDIAPLRGAARDPGEVADVARRIDGACREVGFFRVAGHGVERFADLERLAREFFARPAEAKAEIAMERGGRAWRGWFPLDGELTSGRPDHKEGIYFGTELGPDHPAVRAGRPLHGANLFPASPPGWRAAVVGWMGAMAELGAALLGAMAIGLGLDERWFERHVTGDPTILFRIFAYPPDPGDGWGVAEHTDYGLLTILATDDHDGLQVRGPHGWIDVPSEPDVFVVNLGDMLERMTDGRYRSTPHRVLNTTEATRLSFPCFIDPSWDAECAPLPLGGTPPADDALERRWDGASPRAWEGTYGDYLTAKVAKVFPDLAGYSQAGSRPNAVSSSD